jgi:hypothetical protein
MSATAALRPTEITDRTLESRQLAPAITGRFYGPRITDRFYGPRITGRFYGPRTTDGSPSDQHLEAAGEQFAPAGRFYEMADRMWLTEIEDAAALLDLEDRLLFVEIEGRLFRTA